MPIILLSLLKKYWWIPALLLGSWLWLRTHDASVRYQALAEARLAQIDTLVSKLDEAVAQLAVQDSIHNLQRQRIGAENQKLKIEVSTAKVNTNLQVASLREQLTEQQQTLLDSIRVGYETSLTKTELRLSNTEQLLNSAYEDIAARDVVIKDQNAAIKMLQEENRKNVEASKPSLISRFKDIALPAALIIITLLK